MTQMVQFSSGVLVEQSNFNNRKVAPLPTFTPKPVSASVTPTEAKAAPMSIAVKTPVAATAEVTAAAAAATRAKAAAQAAAEEAARLDAQAAAAYAAAQAESKAVKV